MNGLSATGEGAAEAGRSDANRVWWSLAGWLLIAAAIVVLGRGDPSFRSRMEQGIAAMPAMLGIHFWTEWLASPWFWGSLILSLLAERAFPAVAVPPQERGPHKHLYDLLWIPPKFLFFATLWPLYMHGIQWFVQNHLAFLVVTGASELPWLVRVVGGLLLVDALDWYTHVVRHKVAAFWAFHSIHHSQSKLNFFTEYRSHVFDDVLKWTLEAVPLVLLQHGIVDVLTINRMRYWHTTIYHSNIRSNYGILRYVLVTPQSHRIHHSLAPEHRDKNFGLTFSIWDHLFGTQHRKYDEYPETGIVDPETPVEPARPGLASLRTFAQQFFFPLLGVGRQNAR